MALPDDGVTRGKLLVLEYERLKDEQRQRIGFRDNLIYANLVSLATVIAIVAGSGGKNYLLLLVPPVSILLGWTYLSNDIKVTSISRYIEKKLAVELELITGSRGDVFEWERFHRQHRYRRSWKVLQLAIDLLAFSLPALTALICYWMTEPLSIAFFTISLVEMIGLTALAAQIVLHFEVRKAGQGVV